MSTITNPLVVYLPDTRGVIISSYGKGNLKIGAGVYTYSRLPGAMSKAALGSPSTGPFGQHGTCPGATEECQRICYASRPVTEQGAVYRMWAHNSRTDTVPPIPDDAQLLRLHISGDFDTAAYIVNWCNRLKERPDVVCWVYTRSWRVPRLLPLLEELRALPNVQMFASMDKSHTDMPPVGWRRAWIDGDPRAGTVHRIDAHTDLAAEFGHFELQATLDGMKALICPEETDAVTDCEACGFCFKGQRNDVVFLQH